VTRRVSIASQRALFLSNPQGRARRAALFQAAESTRAPFESPTMRGARHIIMVTYYYVDKIIICEYFHSPMLHWSVMSTPRARKRTAVKDPERLLQAKLPADLVKALRIHALEAETTVKELLTRLIREYLDRQRFQAGRTR